jgi:hypothetical protein
MADLPLLKAATSILPKLIWGTYRSSPSKWHVPSAVVQPAGSAPVEKSAGSPGGVVSPMAALPGGGGWEARLSLPAKLAPVTLALAFEEVGLVVGGAPSMTRPLAFPVGMGVGDPTRLGATIAAVGDKGTLSVNFAVQSRSASAISLVLARAAPSADASADGRSPATPAPAASCLEIALSRDAQATGDVWHARIDGLTDVATLTYAWRADGGLGGDVRGAGFAPGQVMLDPYAPAVAWLALPEGVNVAPGRVDGGLANPPALVGCLGALMGSSTAAPTNPPPVRPNLAAEACVVLEVDPMAGGGDPAAALASLTARVSDLASTGVTTLLVAGPMLAAAPGPAPGAPRAPISLFAPDPALAPPGAASFGTGAGRAIRALIAAAHASGLEVWVQTEACFTAEAAGAPGVDGGAAAATALPRALSLRGLDAVAYYRPGGRVLNAGAPAVRALVLAAARHWAADLGVDGLVWAHAEALVQDRDGNVMDGPALPDALSADPVLRGRVKLVASAADLALLPRQGVRGFPHWGTWLEKNWSLARLLRAWLGDGAPGQAAGLAARVLGSADLVGPAWGTVPDCLAAPRRPAFLLNAIVPPDVAAVGGGVTAAAEAAVAAGPPLDPAAAGAQAATLAKSLLVLSCLLPGSPLLPADALGRGVGGGRFVEALIALRSSAAGAALVPSPAATADADAAASAAGAGAAPTTPLPWRAVAWHGAHSAGEPDWDEGRAAAGEWGANVVAWTASTGAADGRTDAAVFVALNPHTGPVALHLPPAPAGKAWRRAVDTSLTGPADAPPAGERLALGVPDYDLGPRAALVLVAEG